MGAEKPKRLFGILTMLINSFCSTYQLNYYCEMRNALKNLFSHQIALEDHSQFYYNVAPYQLTNALGSIIAVLQEYNFTKRDDDDGQFNCKLYKTKEGNWYDMQDAKISFNKSVLRMLKLAVEIKEGNPVNE